MKKKLTRALIDEIRKEMPVLSREEQRKVSGGDGTDCFFQSIAMLTNQSIESVTNEYVNYYAQKHHLNTAGAAFAIYRDGFDSADMDWAMQHFGLSSGYISNGDYEHSTCGDAGLAIFKDGSCGHAVVITGEASDTEYYYYDPQNNECGTISKNDPRLNSTFNVGSSGNAGNSGNAGDSGNTWNCGNAWNDGDNSNAGNCGSH